MIRTSIFIPIFLFTIMLPSCATSTKSLKVEPILYRTDFEVQYRIAHISNDSSSLQIIAESDNYELSYKAYSALNKKIVLAEEMVSINDSKNQVAIRNFKIREPEYILEIFIKDRDKNRVFRDAVKVNKGSPISHLQITSDNIPVIRPYLPLNTEVNLYHPNESSVWVKYFKREYKAAAPPFSDKGYKFNPRKEVSQLVEIPSGKTIKLEGRGLYFIQADTSLLEGFYINVFDEKFPRISSSSQMVESIRYITKSDEFQRISASDTPKEAIDEFWLKRAKNKTLAKELIKTYYTRIQISNRDFTSYKEGWKTDRGMLYLIFGPPDNVKKLLGGEIWTYASSGKRNTVKFEFKKIHGQTLLIRSDFYKRPWDVEVYEWRKGIINE